MNKLYIAEVISNNDPKNLNRVCIFINGLDDPSNKSNTDLLSWAFILQPTEYGTNNNLSKFTRPQVGSEVVISFIEDDLQKPIIIGRIDNASIDSGVNEKDTIIKDPNGNEIKVKEGSIDIKLISPTNINITGNTSLSIVGNTNINITGNVTETIQGDVTSIINGETKIDTKKDINIKTNKDVKVECKNSEVKCDKSTIDSPETHIKGKVTIDNITDFGFMKVGYICPLTGTIHPVSDTTSLN